MPLSPLLRVQLFGFSTKLERGHLVTSKESNGGCSTNFPKYLCWGASEGLRLWEMVSSRSFCAQCPLEFPPLHVTAIALHCHQADPPAPGPCPSLALVCSHPHEDAQFPESGLPLLPRCPDPAWGSGRVLPSSACPWQTSREDASSSWCLQPPHRHGTQLPKVNTAKPWPMPPLLHNQENLFCNTACSKTEQTLCNRIWRKSYTSEHCRSWNMKIRQKWENAEKLFPIRHITKERGFRKIK